MFMIMVLKNEDYEKAYIQKDSSLSIMFYTWELVEQFPISNYHDTKGWFIYGN